MSKKLEIDWSIPVFNQDLLRFKDWVDAQNLCAAIIRFAEDGTGDLRRVRTPTGREARLYASGHYAWIEFDAKEPVLRALRAGKARPMHLRAVPDPEDVGDVSEDDLEPME